MRWGQTFGVIHYVGENYKVDTVAEAIPLSVPPEITSPRPAARSKASLRGNDKS